MIWMWLHTQIETSGQSSALRLFNLSSQDHNKKISCTAENIVGENESSLVLDILCTFFYLIKAVQTNKKQWLKVGLWSRMVLDSQCIPCGFFLLSLFLPCSLYETHPVPPKITKLSGAISDHHWCIPFSVSGKRHINNSLISILCDLMRHQGKHCEILWLNSRWQQLRKHEEFILMIKTW